MFQATREQYNYQINLQDSMVNEYRLNAEQARDELATTIAKMQSIEEDMKELKQKLTVKNSDYVGLKEENSKLKENNTRQSILISSLRDNLASLEERAVKIDTEHKITSSSVEEYKTQNKFLSEEITRYKEIILELEVVKQSLSTEKSESRTKRTEMFIAILAALGEKSAEWDCQIPDNLNALTSKVVELKNDRDGLKGEISGLKAEQTRLESLLTQSETEVKAGRETIMRLVAETEKMHESECQMKVQISTLEGEKSAVDSTAESLRAQIEELTNSLSAEAEAKASLANQIEELKARIDELIAEKHSGDAGLSEVRANYEKLRENIAALLSCSYQFVDKTDDSIVIRLREFLNEYKSKKCSVEHLENQICELNKKLEDETSRYQKLLEKVMTIEDKSSGNSLLHAERVKFLEFIEKLSKMLKMERIMSEVGLDINSDAVLQRVKQLIEKEDSTLAEKTSTVYTLQRKVKQLKEELEGKELHLDMLRKKVASLEEKSAGKVALFQESEEKDGKIRKLERVNEKLRGQLGDARVQITNLKSEMADINSLKLKHVEKDEEIRILVDKLDHLEKIRTKQAKQLAGLKQELSFVDHEARNTTSLKEENISHLSEQLTHAKRALEEVAKRERQLVEFRSLVAKMLGMQVSALTVPDYEIVSKLERLIHHHHVETTTNIGTDMDNFWEGYERAKERLTQKKKPATQSAW